jgi:TolA-binding protein
VTCAPFAAEQVDAAHIAECLACRRAVEAQRALEAQLAQLPVPVLDRERRQALAAEVMARADLHDDTRALPRARVGGYLAGAVAAAALIAAIVRDERGLAARVERRSIAIDVAAPDVERAVPDRDVAVDRVPRAFEPAPVVPIEKPAAATDPAHGAEPARASDPSRSVFGSTAAKRSGAIDREMLVEQTPVEAFRVGWEALREARYADAIAAFDRATDPAVAEDAAFWAAIAAARAGQPDDARKRLDLFLATFPDSPRAESARRAREVLR